MKTHTGTFHITTLNPGLRRFQQQAAAGKFGLKLNPMSLYHLVNHLCGTLLSSNSKQKIIVNNISPGLQAGVKKEALAMVLQRLLDDLYRHSISSEIKISARRFNGVTVVQIKHKDSRLEPLINRDITDVKQLARKLGGCIYLSCTDVATTISFTYVNTNCSEVTSYSPDNESLAG